MPRDISKYPPTLRRIFQNQDSTIGFFAMWGIGLTILPLGGFYLATICSPYTDADGLRHYWDMTVADMHFGGYGALLGLASGILLGLWATFRYPLLKEMEEKYDIEHHIHHYGTDTDPIENPHLQSHFESLE